MRALRIFLITVLTAALLTGIAYGGGYAVRQLDDDKPSAADDADTEKAPAPEDEKPSDPAPDESEGTEGTEEPSRPAKPQPVLAPGDTGEQVRELQHRLYQMLWLPEKTTGKYDAATREAVAGWQEKRGFTSTGIVDKRTWNRLLEMTKTPTHDQKFNILKPGPTLLGPGDSGDKVRDLQARLKQIAWLSGLVTGTYDGETTGAIRGFQAKRGIPQTGKVDQRTLDRLHAMTSTPSHDEKHNVAPKSGSTDAPLDPRCTTGRALCVDKSSNTVRWVIDGKVLSTFDARFGRAELPTREGAFSVQRKSRDHVSSIYHTSMPFAMFFSGGQAVHYSPDFAANGYNGASHGCVNVRDYDGMVWLFDQVQVGDKVIVYWS